MRLLFQTLLAFGKLSLLFKSPGAPFHFNQAADAPPGPPSIHQPAAQLLLYPLPRPLRGSTLLTSAAVQNGGVAQWLAVSSTGWTTLAGHWSWASQLSPQSPSPYLVNFENGLLRMELTSTGDSTLRRPCSGVLTSPNLPPTEFSRISRPWDGVQGPSSRV